jgi:hypothetical protein
MCALIISSLISITPNIPGVFRFELRDDDDDDGDEVRRKIFDRYRRNGYTGLSMMLAYSLKHLIVNRIEFRMP